MNTVLVTFTPHLNEEMIKGSFQVSKFVEGAQGELPQYVTPKIEFDKEKLEIFIAKDYKESRDYISESRRIAKTINDAFHTSCNKCGRDLTLVDFEADFGLLDEHLVTINEGDMPLAVICTEDDFEKIVGEL